MVGTLFGPSQVLSRFINMVFGGGLSQLVLALISAVLLPAALVILIATAPSVAGVRGGLWPWFRAEQHRPGNSAARPLRE